MKYFYRLLEGSPQGTLMNALLQRPEVFTTTAMDGVQELTVREQGPDGVVTDQAGAREFAGLKRLSLAAMQMTDGTMLGRSVLLRVDAKVTMPIGNSAMDLASYAVVLHAEPNVMILAGDESVLIRGGEIWWIDLKSDAHLINKSEDEVFIMIVDVRIDP